MEHAKQEIWRNPDKYLPAAQKILATLGIGTQQAEKTLTGILDDLAKIYTGEKTIEELDAERDALQVLRTVKDLPGPGTHIDPYEVAARIRATIDNHIQDPLLRKAYHEVIDHYQATYHQIPRNREYLKELIRRERELEERLQQLTHEDRKLTKTQIRRLSNLYRMLNLLTTHPTLHEMRRFYHQLFQDRRIRVESEEFLPVHGPLITTLAEDFGELRRTPEKEYREKAVSIVASYEPLLYTGPLIEKEACSIVAGSPAPIIPMEEHRKFIESLGRM